MKRVLFLTVWLCLVPALLLACGRPIAVDPARHAAAAPSALFRDITAAAGITFRHRSGVVRALHPNLLQTTGSGCAVWDYDGDGWLDLYLVDGDHAGGGENRLYRNRGDGTFDDVTDQAGVLGHGYGMGCAVGDYDGDGDPDLYVTNYGPNILYRNNGDGTLTDVTREAGVAVPQWSTVAAFFDAEGDGDLDLYVGQYVKFSERSKQLCDTMGVLGGCNPSEYAAEGDVLLINRGDGQFEERTRDAGIRDANGRALGVLVDDYDADGRPDIFVANDGSANFLFHNEGRGQFRDVAVPAGVAYGVGGRAEASMGCDFGDYDEDGHLDLVIGNFEGEMDSLYRNLGRGMFMSVATQSGIGLPTIAVLTFGIGFLDFDCDGDLDLAQANGHVHPLLETVDPEAAYRQPRQLFENLGNGKFREITAAAGAEFDALTVGRGMAFGDIDNDGDIDVLTNNNGAPAVLLRNDARRTNHWLGVRLARADGEARVLGARVTLEAGEYRRTRYARTAYSYASANDPRVHFGLRSHAGPVQLVVAWPDGRETRMWNVPVDRYVTVTVEGLAGGASREG